MKCIRNNRSNEVTRVPDYTAHEKVLTGKFSYVNKTTWRSYKKTKEKQNEQG